MDRRGDFRIQVHALNIATQIRLFHDGMCCCNPRLNVHVNGRLVANSVTFEGEQRLFEVHQKLGGDLNKIDISRAQTVGGFSSWQALMSVTQLKMTKP